jgi:hypothetical protein
VTRNAGASSISVSAVLLYDVLSQFNSVEIKNLRRITLAGMPYNIAHMAESIACLAQHAPRLTNLNTIAVQSPVAHYKFNINITLKRHRQAPLFTPETTWRDLAIIRKLDDIFGARVTIVLDAWMCFSPGHRLHERGGEGDEMVVVRGVLWRGDGDGERRTSFAMRRGDVVQDESESRVNLRAGSYGGAKWSRWWVGKGLAYGRKGN